MTAIEEKALNEIKRLVHQADHKTTQLSVKLLNDKDVISHENDVYPIGSDLREVVRWVDAILENK